jgi:ATP/maltotriose-dependent transcriptional regulator MalT
VGQQFSEQIVSQLDQAVELYHQLILIVAPAGAGKTAALQEVVKAQPVRCRYINVNLELSRGLLDLTERQRPLQVQRLLNDIVRKEGPQIVLLDNLELLFDVSLQQDPLRLLQGLSRNRTIVARKRSLTAPASPSWQRVFVE